MWGRRSCEPLCSGGRGGPVSGPPAAPSSEARACSGDPSCISLRKSQVSPQPRVILDLVAPPGWFPAALESTAGPPPLFLPPRCWEEGCAAPSTVGGGTGDWALPGVDLGHAAFERGDPNTRLNPSLRFCTCNMEIMMPFSRRAARIDGDAR